MGRVPLGHKVIPGCKKVVKDVLLLQQHASLVPRLTKLSPAAKVGHGIDAAAFKKRDVARAEARRQTDVEPSIGVEQGGVAAVLLNSLFVDDEHGDSGSVFGDIPLLMGLKIVRIEGHVRSAPKLRGT